MEQKIHGVLLLASESLLRTEGEKFTIKNNKLGWCVGIFSI